MGIPFQMQETSPKKGRMEMKDFMNPSKRIRLDFNCDRNAGNEDLWGAEDITADEFDMLEFQATQSVVQQESASNFHPPCNNFVVNPVALQQDDALKQQQYELEGKIQLLNQSLEKITRELKEEKLNKDKLINERVQEFQAKENVLRKEIKKMESALLFKDQEMKSIYDKIHCLEAQLQEKKEIAELQPTQPIEFIKRFKFEADAPVPSTSNGPETNKSSRRHKLPVDTPEGNIPGSSIISSLFCNRLSTTSFRNPYFSPLPSTSDAKLKNFEELLAVTIATISSNQQVGELFDYFNCVFKNYLNSLKNAATLSVTNSPMPQRRKEADNTRTTVIQCLKDLACILSCPEFLELSREDSLGRYCSFNQSEMAAGSSTEPTTHFCVICDIILNAPQDRAHSLLKTLVSLASPGSYPTCLQNDVEIELSLFCLLSWISTPESLIQFVREIPFSSLISTYSTSTSLYLIIQVLANLCHHKKLAPLLTHSSDECLLCTISSVALNKIAPSPLEFSPVLHMMEDFLSSLFISHTFLELKLESNPCPSLVLQGIVMSLWSLLSACKNMRLDMSQISIFKKGISLIYILSRYFPDFKEMRSAFEDNYVSLVCGVLKLSKESPGFKELHDLIHNLWDFQEETTEFDFDESSQDSSSMMELMSQSNS